MNFAESLKQFQTELESILGTDALNKGYAQNTEQGGRELFDNVAFLAPGHSSGEIIYKVTRLDKLHDPRDAVKIAAWAFLKWDSEMRKKG